MTQDEFKTWLDAYGRAWETRDANTVADLFSDDAAYHETPFVEPWRGPKSSGHRFAEQVGSAHAH